MLHLARGLCLSTSNYGSIWSVNNMWLVTGTLNIFHASLVPVPALVEHRTAIANNWSMGLIQFSSIGLCVVPSVYV